jgi:hypothetical protein
MAKYIRQPAGAAPIVPAVQARPAGVQVPVNLITPGPYGTVYSTSTTLVTADGAMITGYLPAYSTGRPVPAGRGRG